MEDCAVRRLGVNGAIAVIGVPICGLSPRLQASQPTQKRLANALNAISTISNRTLYLG